MDKLIGVAGLVVACQMFAVQLSAQAKVTLPGVDEKVHGSFFSVPATVPETHGVSVGCRKLGHRLESKGWNNTTGEVQLAKGEVLFYRVCAEDSDASLKEVAAVSQLAGIFCDAKPKAVTCAGLKALSAAKNLRFAEIEPLLSCGSTRTAWVAGLPAVEVLELGDSGFRDPKGKGGGATAVEFKAMLGLKKLRVLRMPRGECADAEAAKALGNLKTLEELQIMRGPGVPETVAAVAGLPKLQSLQLHLLLTGDLPTLAGCKNLKKLVLNNAGCDPAELASLSALKQLKHLELHGWQAATATDGQYTTVFIKEYPLAGLAGLTQLETLSLHGCKSKASEFGKLSALTALTELDLSDTAVDDVWLASLLRLKGLQVLNLQGCAKVEGSAFILMPPLVSLNLAGTSVDDDTITVLYGCKTLKSLDLSGCTKLTPKALPALGHMKALETLSLRNVAVDDAGLKDLVKCGMLRTLDLEGAAGYTDVGLRALVGLKELRELKGTHTNKALSRDARIELERHCEANAKR